MKESKEELKSEIYKTCSICNKRNLEIKENDLKFLKQYRKIKANLKAIDISELIEKCYCNNNSNSYAHKYCILQKIIINFEIKCDKCNSFYNIKIDKIKKVDLSKKVCVFIVFIFIYFIHLIIYILCIFFIFIIKDAIDIKYYHVPIFFGCVLFLINTIILHFSLVNNIHHCKYLIKYKIDIFNIKSSNNNNNNNNRHFFELVYEFYMWLYDKSKTKILLEKHKNFLINRINNNELLNNYIKENNNNIIIIKKDKTNKKIEENISNNHIDKSNSNHCFNLNSVCKNESENPIDAIKKNIHLLEQQMRKKIIII